MDAGDRRGGAAHLESRRRGDFRIWSGSLGPIEARFAGKDSEGSRPLEQVLRTLLPDGVEPAWLEQIHSAVVRPAEPGANAPGDALFTDETALALVVVTADCVPVLLAASDTIAAVHAGWRGLAQRILPATVGRMAAGGGAVTAWIGPSIGPCCYEVGDEVAAQVALASSEAVLHDGSHGRPHLDLAEAARVQLLGEGVTDIRRVEACTRCDEERLWSYRRDGSGAGRNLAAIWRWP